MSRGERGSVSVETALVLPALVGVLAMLVGGLGWAHSQWLAYHAAGSAARVAITHEDAQAVSAAQRIVPGAQATVSRSGQWVRVTVRVPSRGWWPGVSATVEAFDP